jgi:hypothetical protein
MQLKIVLTGTARVVEHTFTSFFGISPGTKPLGFFALLILHSTSQADTFGAKLYSLFAKKSCTFGGKSCKFRGENSWLILEKCSAIISADWSELKFSSE